MTMAEYTALVLLARNCRDRAVLRRALALVPDLREVVDEPPGEGDGDKVVPFPGTRK